MTIAVDVLTGIGGQYATQWFKLKNVRSEQLWRALAIHDVSFRRRGDKLHLVLMKHDIEVGQEIELETLPQN